MERIIEKKLFTNDELNILRKNIENLSYRRSKVTKNNYEESKVSDMRTSHESLIYLNDGSVDFILENLKQLGVKSLPDYAHVLKYSPGDEFKKHRDSGIAYPHRYRTVIIQLSSEDEYEGGELEIYKDKTILTVNKSFGNTVIFDSSLVHCANKLLSGTRYCIVIWLEKKHFGFNFTLI